jgi:hypothetical protein
LIRKGKEKGEAEGLARGGEVLIRKGEEEWEERGYGKRRGGP